MGRGPVRNWRKLAESAILFAAQNGHESDCNHMGRYLTALDMIRGIVRRDMKVVDLASFGTLLPVLRKVLGINDLTVTGIPLNTLEAHGELRFPPTADGDVFTCPFDRFDIEGPFPYADGTFDLVLLTEVLEHLSRDPMHTIGEINRITKTGGWLLLSTPNCCSLRSLTKALRGQHPYLWAQYSALGHRDRHNREYTPEELRVLLEDAGYQIAKLITCDDSYVAVPSPPSKRCLRWLAKQAVALASLMAGRYVSPALRGESNFVLARKLGMVNTRFPTFLYYEIPTKNSATSDSSTGQQRQQAAEKSVIF
jgi:SAM-dependent methyltransferase